MEKKIQQILQRYNLSGTVVKKPLTTSSLSLKDKIPDSPQKALFIDTIELLEEIEDKSAEIAEIGIDLSLYESLFFQVIENLFYATYNTRQMDMIHSYLYGIPLSSNPVALVDKNGNVLDPETPEELWTALQILR